MRFPGCAVLWLQKFTEDSLAFQEKIITRSGLGPQTYLPPGELGAARGREVRAALFMEPCTGGWACFNALRRLFTYRQAIDVCDCPV